MRKRSVILIILPIVIFIISIFFVTNLSSKNKVLGFLSDDSRQVAIMQDIYKKVLTENVPDKANVSKDTSVYINFITYNHYVISHQNSLDNIFKEFQSDESDNKYILSTSFDLQELTLTVILESNDHLDVRKYIYKLNMNKLKNKIDYKLINAEFVNE